MRTLVKNRQGDEDIVVNNDDEDITIWQGEDLVMLFDAKMARKVIKAIRKSAKELGWEV